MTRTDNFKFECTTLRKVCANILKSLKEDQKRVLNLEYHVCYVDTIIISMKNRVYNKNADIKYMFSGSIFKHITKISYI